MKIILRFGCHKILKNIFDLLQDDIPDEIKLSNDIGKIKAFIRENTLIAPNDIMYVKKNIREGVLPQILKELLLTRIMIKNSTKKVIRY